MGGGRAGRAWRDEDGRVSIEVDLGELDGAVAARTGPAYLVTVRDRRPHVVQVPVRCEAGVLEVPAGRRSALNLADHPDVTVLWPTDGLDPRHSLIVDGTARADGDTITVTPTRAVLHRSRRGPART